MHRQITHDASREQKTPDADTADRPRSRSSEGLFSVAFEEPTPGFGIVATAAFSVNSPAVAWIQQRVPRHAVEN
jgi:hypothetical protein